MLPSCARVALLGALLTTLAAPHGAWADPSPARVASVQEARERYRDGANAFDEGRYKDAIDHFLDANRMAPNPAFSYNIGLAYEHLGDAPNALRYYRDYLRRVPDAADREEVTERILHAEARLAERGVQQVTILSSPTGATVNIDGQPVGVTPWTGELVPGEHRATLHLRGHADAVERFSLEATRARDVALTLEKATPGPVAQETSPRLLASTPTEKPLEDRAGPSVSPLTWVALGVGAAGLGTAVGLELSRSSAEDAARAARVQVDARDDLEAAQSLQTASRVAAGIGAAALITGGVLLYFDLSGGENLSADARAGWKAAAGCGGGRCGLAVNGSF